MNFGRGIPCRKHRYEWQRKEKKKKQYRINEDTESVRTKMEMQTSERRRGEVK